MPYAISRHALEEMVRRGIPRAEVESVLASPEQRISQSPEVEILQSRFKTTGGKMLLLRVVVASGKEPPVVITAYRTSKIEKYWRPE